MTVEDDPLSMSDMATAHHVHEIFFLIDLLLLYLFDDQINDPICSIATLQVNIISYISRLYKSFVGQLTYERSLMHYRQRVSNSMRLPSQALRQPIFWIM